MAVTGRWCFQWWVKHNHLKKPYVSTQNGMVDFGSENGPKISEISSFGALRFASAIRAGKSLISKRPQSWKSLVLLSKIKVFHKTKLLPTGTIFNWFSTPKLLWNPLKVASKCYCFFIFVSEANLNDVEVQFGAPKPLTFWENQWLMKALEGTLLCMPFGATLKHPGTNFEGFSTQNCSTSGNLIKNFVAKLHAVPFANVKWHDLLRNLRWWLGRREADH